MSIFGIGPQTGLFAFLDGSGMDPNEDQKFLQSRNPQPIDPLNENKFDPNQYGLQVTDNTFQSEPGMTLQDMLAQYENTDRVRQLSENPAINYDGLYQDPDRFLDYDNTRVDRTNQADYPFTGNIPTNRRARYDARAYNRNEPLPSPYGMKGGTFFEDFDPRVGQTSQQEIYQDRIRNENLPGFSYQAEEPIGIESINIEDAPQIKEAIYQDRIMNPNLPGFAYQPKESVRNIIGSQLQNAKTKAGQGFDFAQQIPGMLLSAATGIPFAGQIAQGIGGLLSNIFQESPEQKNFRENIATDPEYQNLVNSIPGMSNYNQIYSRGSGRGLMGAADRRLKSILNTENRRKRQGLELSDTLKERRKKLEALRELERQKESAFLESQRRGRRPGTGGDGGGGTQDSGGPTGGYSYDSGGRQGFGYGLKDGGLASMFTRRG
jgi:hypothetical protein